MIASVGDMVADATAQLGSVTPDETSSEIDTGAAGLRVPGCPATATSSTQGAVLRRVRRLWATMSVDMPFGASRQHSVQYIVGSEKWQSQGSVRRSSQRGFRRG